MILMILSLYISTPLRKMLEEDSDELLEREAVKPKFLTASPLPRDKVSRSKYHGNTCKECEAFYKGILPPMSLWYKFW